MQHRQKETQVSDLVRTQAGQIFSLLLKQIGKDRPEITYAELAEKLGVRVCHLRFPMDHLCETLGECEITAKTHLPPIQVLVVNGKTRVPGPGASPFIRVPYLEQGKAYKDLSLPEQRQVIAAIHEDITSYRDWNMVERNMKTLL